MAFEDFHMPTHWKNCGLLVRNDLTSRFKPKGTKSKPVRSGNGSGGCQNQRNTRLKGRKLGANEQPAQVRAVRFRAPSMQQGSGSDFESEDVSAPRVASSKLLRERLIHPNKGQRSVQGCWTIRAAH